MANIYATWNPADKGTNVTLSGGDLSVSISADGAWDAVRSTISKTSGKWYWEYTMTGTNAMSGILLSTATLSSFLGADANGWGYYDLNGNKYTNGASVAYGATYTTGDVIGVALDMDSGTVVFYKNNTSQGTAYTGLSGAMFAAMSGSNISAKLTANFGATALTYTPPSGYNSGLYDVVSNNGAGFFAMM